MSTTHRSFVLRHTRLRAVPGVDGLRLHLADDVRAVWHATQVETGDPDAPLPYWACAWSGGLALARYLADHPERVAGRRVADIGAGSGIVAIAAMRAGAERVVAIDFDPFAIAAIDRNARANGQRIDATRRNVLDGPPPEVDIVLAGDCCYDASLATRLLPWLRGVRAAGIDVLLGDPGRADLPLADLIELATYDVRTTSELEDLDHTRGIVYALRDVVTPRSSPGPASGAGP